MGERGFRRDCAIIIVSPQDGEESSVSEKPGKLDVCSTRVRKYTRVCVCYVVVIDETPVARLRVDFLAFACRFVVTFVSSRLPSACDKAER